MEQQMKAFLIQEIVEPYFVERFSRYFHSIPLGLEYTPHPNCIEIALWDLIGKEAELPLYKLLGACQERVRAYCTTDELYPLWAPEEYVDFARKILKVGFTAIKPHIGWRQIPDTARILRVIKALRDELGEKIDIIIDVNQAFIPCPAFTLYEAIKFAKALEQYNVLWLEEPLLHLHNPEMGTALCNAVDLPIAGGSHIIGWQNFKTVLQQGSLDVVLPDIQCCGGLSEMRKIALLSESYGKQCWPHGSIDGVTYAATMQVVGSTMMPWMEYKYQPPFLTDEVRDAVLTKTSHLDAEGYSHVPQEPGIGVTLNENKVEEYTVW
jgi:L-alanine-DL-glutamate epimerase-like enolase superfamily enzyme